MAAIRKSDNRVHVLSTAFVLVLILSTVMALAAASSTTAAQNGGPEGNESTPPEALNLNMYSRIRDEGINHSHVMEYAGALMDNIGPRLTGSPAMTRAEDWARAQLTAMGCKNVHLESWGDFGMAWTQLSASLNMVKPVPGVFLAQATPWSPATNGAVTADVIHVPGLQSDGDLAKWKGKLKGKVILYGHGMNPDVNPDSVPAMRHDGLTQLADLARYPLKGSSQAEQLKHFRKFFAAQAFQEKVAKFFAEQGAVAVLEPGGSGGVLHDDTGASMGWYVYDPQHRQAIPEEVISDEAWDRMERLLGHKVPVSVTIDISTRFGDSHTQGYNTIAEIPGTDPKRKNQVVMAGAHLDSWIAGTGATDNGAGVIVAMEAMRILNSLHVKPLRTIRIALWSGEEEGAFGSMGYVARHYATSHYSSAKQDADLPLFVKPMIAPPTMKPAATELDAYYNMDNGTGKVLGVYAEGNQAAAAIFSQWMKPLQDLGVTTIAQLYHGGSDNIAFQMVGLPGFAFIQDPRDYESRTHHTNLDTYEHLSPPDLKQAAVVEAIFLYDTAMRKEMLPRPTFPFRGQHKPLTGLYPDAVK